MLAVRTNLDKYLLQTALEWQPARLTFGVLGMRSHPALTALGVCIIPLHHRFKCTLLPAWCAPECLSAWCSIYGGSCTTLQLQLLLLQSQVLLNTTILLQLCECVGQAISGCRSLLRSVFVLSSFYNSKCGDGMCALSCLHCVIHSAVGCPRETQLLGFVVLQSA